MRRTKLQDECDRIDLDIYRTMRLLGQLAADTTIVRNRTTRDDLVRAAGNLRMARVYVRKHMNEADAKVTQGE